MFQVVLESFYFLADFGISMATSQRNRTSTHEGVLVTVPTASTAVNTKLQESFTSEGIPLLWRWPMSSKARSLHILQEGRTGSLSFPTAVILLPSSNTQMSCAGRDRDGLVPLSDTHSLPHRIPPSLLLWNETSSLHLFWAGEGVQWGLMYCLDVFHSLLPSHPPLSWPILCFSDPAAITVQSWAQVLDSENQGKEQKWGDLDTAWMLEMALWARG